MNIAFPYHIDGRGRTAAPVDNNAYLVQLIEQVLFTAPGERVNRPNFGSGVAQLTFAPNSAELAAATQFVVQGGLNQWLGGLVQIQTVQVAAQDSTLTVTVSYVPAGAQTPQVAQFTRGF